LLEQLKMQLNTYLARLYPKSASTSNILRKWQTIYFVVILIIISGGIGFTIWQLTKLIRNDEHSTPQVNEQDDRADSASPDHATPDNDAPSYADPNHGNSATNDKNTSRATTGAAASTIISATASANDSPQHHLHLGNGYFKNTNNTELLFGAKTLQNTKLKNFIGYGDIALYDSTVSGTVTVYGDMQTNNVRINDTIIYGSAQLHDTDVKNRLSIYGEAFLINSKVNGDSTIFGTVDTNNTVFRGDITAATSKFTLLDTQTKGITIQKFKDKNKKDKNVNQIIRILGKSVINGDITFETGGGIIELGSQATINGKVTGGMLKRNKK